MTEPREVVIRRAFLWRMQCEGKRLAQIRTEWNNSAPKKGFRKVSIATIKRDSATIRREGREDLQKVKGDAEGVVADSIRRYETIFHVALRDYRKHMAAVSKKGNATSVAVGFLRVALDAQKRLLDLLQDTGYLRRDLGVLRIDDTKRFESMTEEEVRAFVSDQDDAVEDVIDILTKHGREGGSVQPGTEREQ